MRFVIVTGMSGAGKSIALKMLEDMGYFCVDNLPIALVSKFVELAAGQQTERPRVALGIDIRSGELLNELQKILEELQGLGLSYEILFLEAAAETLVKRYKETRRTHPLAKGGRVDKGIAEERGRLAFLKKQADYIIDTSKLLTRELNQELNKIFEHNQEFKNIVITMVSFGFKYGIPGDSDLVFDVRFLPNPYYIEELRIKTGNDKEVSDYVMKTDLAGEFLAKLKDLSTFLIPNYIIEGKNQLIISIGCTGGKHRSVTLANKLYEYLSQQNEYSVKIEHRDVLR